MTYLIRIMTTDDAAAVANLHVAAWQAAYRGIIDDEILDNMNTSDREKRWRKNLEGDDYNLENIVYVDADKRVLGFASYGEERDDGRSDRGELWAIYVHPDSWGKGVGPNLWNHLADHRKKYKRGSVVWVLSENASAIKFYEGLGFEKDGATKDFIYQGKSFPELRMFL